jgi:hypothetical protein
MKNFVSIFKDGNDWNEKSIIGFIAFAVMVLFAIVDLGTGLMGQELVITDTIYNSFVWITLGSFGIDGVTKFAGKKENKDEIN